MSTIDRHIPPPANVYGVTTHGNKPGRPPKYPFSEMEIGDSFLAKTSQSNILTAARLWARTNNKSHKFTTRKQPDGIRIWRIE